MASSTTMSAFLIVLVFLASTVVHGGVVKVCNGELSYADCSNCCALKKGCMYLQPGTGYPTCIGGEQRACPRNCEGPKLVVCPKGSVGTIGKSDVSIVTGKLPPSENGCNYYNIDNGDLVPKVGTNELVELEKKKKCKVDSLVQVCNGVVSKENCGCCSGTRGCLFLENQYANSTCLPANKGICPLICLPTVSVCSKSMGFIGTTLESCVNARQSCEEMDEGCSLYDRGTGEDKCAATIKKYGEA